MFRTIEGLCAGLDLNSSRPLEVTHETREQVLLELTNCTTALDLIAAQAGTPDRERIWGLKSRLKEIEANRPSFPTQLEALIDRANLPDASWLRDFRFRTRIDKAPTRWTSAAGAYRNRIFHAGFIDFEKYDIDNAISFISHLSDVLIRVVFGLIGFDGQYKPPCGTHGMTIHNNRYWPTSVELSAPLLRYVD